MYVCTVSMHSLVDFLCFLVNQKFIEKYVPRFSVGGPLRVPHLSSYPKKKSHDPLYPKPFHNILHLKLGNVYFLCL